MPYRRLPNTDQARLRALQAALVKASKVSPFDLAFSQKVFLKLKSFVPYFEQTISQYNFSKDRQAQYGKLLGDQVKVTRLYISHFVQVLNFCIIRGEIKPEARLAYNLALDDKAVPDLTTETQIKEIGADVIRGEEKRIMSGGSRIYNPSIAMVKVKYDKFLEYYNNHKNLLVTTQKHHEKVTELREVADDLIVHLWNEVEASFEHLIPDEKREKSAEYGVIYLLRKHEKEQIAGDYDHM